jgi:two-component system response regulator WspF
MKIAIVNDMLLAVEALRHTVTQTRHHELAWVARNGAEAVSLCARNKPDLVLMDLMMPEMDGIEATRHIMARTPCAIMVVTADVDRHASSVFEALSAGAIDAANTPVFGGFASQTGVQPLLTKIDTIARLVADDQPNGRLRPGGESDPTSTEGTHRLVAIGASAGGPPALARILSSLPKDFSAAVVIVQHVEAGFAPGLARWLGQHTPLRVRLAREGDRPRAGTVLLAGQEHHLVFTGPARLGYTRVPTNGFHRPSIDVFFKSIQRHWRGDLIGILLTGMGRDGSEGLKSLRAAGHHTIAQDEATSAVYGMPRAAVELQAASETLSLDNIGPRLVKMLE